jgi:hypothetical protein
MMRRLLLALLLVLAPATDAYAQSLDEIDRLQAALIAAWEKTPLTVRHAMFVAEKPQGFGMYQQRASNVFKSGEPLITYAEPVGYGWKDVGGGKFEFGFAVDFAIKSPDGTVLTTKQDFANMVLQRRTRNLEFMVALTLTLTDAPAGDYIVEYKLRDVAGTKSTSFELPFTITQ